jgi:hypothetical protein
MAEAPMSPALSPRGFRGLRAGRSLWDSAIRRVEVEEVAAGLLGPNILRTQTIWSWVESRAEIRVGAP